MMECREERVQSMSGKERRRKIKQKTHISIKLAKIVK